MIKTYLKWTAAGLVFASSPAVFAGTPPFFEPLTESAPVTAPNSSEETTAPWVVPAGVSQKNLTSMREIEADPSQSVVRAPAVTNPTGEVLTTGDSQSMWDMAAFDATGRFVFNPHETPWGAGLSRYDRLTDKNVLLWKGDNQGALGNWSKDYGAFDPATFTPNCTVFVAEEWTAEGRLIETLNPFASPAAVQTRELQSIPNVAHEGLQFSKDERTLYFVDEWNSGSIYKFVPVKKGDYTKGQTFVLKVDAFDGDPAADYNQGVNAGKVRTGAATWVPLTTAEGVPVTTTDPFRNGPTDDPRTNPATRGGRGAADEVGATPYGRPEDLEIGRLANGKEVVYFAATSENSIYAIQVVSETKAIVQLFASNTVTPKNVGFAATTGVLNSPDNLAQDALGNIYVIEDAPNSSTTGGDIWFVRDVNNDGVAESLDHFLSIRVAGSEATGMIFSPTQPTKFVVNVQHPASANLDKVPGGFGDALWSFDVKRAKSPAASSDATCGEGNPVVQQLRWAGVRKVIEDRKFISRCTKAAREQMREDVEERHTDADDKAGEDDEDRRDRRKN